jgi:hypothetical protein
VGLVERVEAVRHQILVVVLLHLEQQIQVVAEAVHTLELLAQAVLVLSFFHFQQPNTQAQPQAHQLSRQVAQTQF